MANFLGALFGNKSPIAFVQQGGGRENFFAASKDSTGGAPGAAHLKQYGQVGTLFAIVNSLAVDTSMVEWKLYKKQTDRRRRYVTPDGTDGRVEVTRHPALSVWQNPNPYMTQQEFVESFQQHLELTGEAWWTVGRNPDFPEVGPLELWIARPDKMGVLTDAQEFLTGYYYVTPDGGKQRLEKSEVIQLRMPNPLDPYRGMGPVQSIMVDLDSARYAAQYNRNFFKNGAVPGAIIQVPEHMTDDEFDEFQQRWASSHKGVDNAHRVGIVENGAVYVESKFAQRDMQFAELRGVSSEAIREAFRYPKNMLGTTDDVNRANAEAGEYTYAKHLMLARLERIKQALNANLLPMFDGGDQLEFDYTSPVPEDTANENVRLTTQVTSFTALVTAGADPEEAAQIVGLPPMKKFEKPTPPAPVIAPQAPDSGTGDGNATDPSEETPPASNTFGDAVLAVFAKTRIGVEYVVDAKSDGDVCAPCAANDKHVYTDRTQAYTDYPGGKGYIKCIGAKYGNQCRCTLDVEEA